MLKSFGQTAGGARCARLMVLALNALLLGGCVQGAGAGRGPFPAFSQYEDRQVRAVEFLGDLRLPEDSLKNVIVTRATRCWLVFLPVCLPFTNFGRNEYRLNLNELSRDVARLDLYYRDHGYYGTRIAPSVDPLGEDEVAVRFAIAPGDQVTLTALEVDGVEDILDTAMVANIVQLGVGEPFRRIGFLRSADTIASELHARGYAYAEVLRNYSLDTIADIAQAQYIALPGPLVRVDTILFAGVDRLSERTLRRQVTVREGQLLRLPDLGRSQRNLYDLQMVSFASLEIAPDSLQRDEDLSSATVLARVIEAPQYVVDAAVGIGTVDCLRTEATYRDRNFLGGGRSLEVNGGLSKIGVGPPLDWGMEGSVCSGSVDRPPGVQQDIVRVLNYRVAADFQQPRLFATRNELGVGAHWERLTELNAYLRESAGGQLSLTRDIGVDKLLNVSFGAEHGRTLASPLVFCVGFDICATEDFSELQRFRWSNVIAASALWDARRPEGLVTRGFYLRGAVDWTSPVLLSDNRYLRVVGDASAYRPLRPGWVLAANLRLGAFLQGRLGLDDGGFIPPERRFYAGGPNSVRGYRRNALGPTAYVETERLTSDGEIRRDTLASAIGGTRIAVANLEVRMPSPIYPEYFRIAAFVDAGQVWAPGTELYDIGSIKVTPGAGLRVATPVGPIRLDVAYNPYAAPTGPLYHVLEDSGDLVLIDSDFRPSAGGFWDRLEVSFAVGQAF